MSDDQSLMVIAGVLVLILLLFTAGRLVVNWYFKIDERLEELKKQSDMIERIGLRLKSIDEKLTTTQNKEA